MGALEIVTLASWIAALVILIHKRHELRATLARIPVKWRIAVGALLIACAFIPGPIDDLIVTGLIARMARGK